LGLEVQGRSDDAQGAACKDQSKASAKWGKAHCHDYLDCVLDYSEVLEAYTGWIVVFGVVDYMV
jgi:hypothetical protein